MAGFWVPVVLGAQRVRLTAPASFKPAGAARGVYVLRYEGDHALYRDERRTGHPIYIGSGCLAKRIAKHARTLDDSRDLDPGDFTVAWTETDGHEIALVAEQLAIEDLDPAWNRREMRGFGSNARGAGRAGQQASPWAALHG